MDIAHVRSDTQLTVYRFDTPDGWTAPVQLTDGSVVPPSSTSMTNYILPFPIAPDVAPKHAHWIPHTVIQTAEHEHDSNETERVIHAYNRALNPEYTFVFFSARERLEFLTNAFGADDDVVRAYTVLIPGAFQADLFRYCYLWMHGGVYIDNKMIMRKPFRDFIRGQDTCLLCVDYDRQNTLDRHTDPATSYLNAIICTAPHNPMMKNLLNACVHNVLRRQREFMDSIQYIDYQEVLEVTGPTLMYTTLHDNVEPEHLRFKHVIVDHDETQYRNFQIVERDAPHALIATKTWNTVDQPNHYSKHWIRRHVFWKPVSVGIQDPSFRVMVSPLLDDGMEVLVTVEGMTVVVEYGDTRVQWTFQQPFESMIGEEIAIYYIPQPMTME